MAIVVGALLSWLVISNRDLAVASSVAFLFSELADFADVVLDLWASSAGEERVQAFNRLNREYATRNLALVRISAVMRPLIQFVIGLGMVLIVWYGGVLAVRGEMTDDATWTNPGSSPLAGTTSTRSAGSSKSVPSILTTPPAGTGR